MCVFLPSVVTCGAKPRVVVEVTSGAGERLFGSLLTSLPSPFTPASRTTAAEVASATCSDTPSPPLLLAIPRATPHLCQKGGCYTIGYEERGLSTLATSTRGALSHASLSQSRIMDPWRSDAGQERGLARPLPLLAPTRPFPAEDTKKRRSKTS